MQVDLLGEKCAECGLGSYVETSIYDDWEGKLHCSECNHEVKRHQDVATADLRWLRKVK